MHIRIIRKLLSWILIILALWFFSPPGLPPDDIINMVVGGYIADFFNITLTAGILITYTIIPIILLYLACVISPNETNGMFKKMIEKLKGIVRKILSNPALLIAGIIIIIIMYYVYVTYLIGYLGVNV